MDHESLLAHVNLNGVVLEDVSPYFHQYLAHRIEKGKLNFKGSVDIDNGQLKSLLALRVDSLEISKKEMHDEAFDLSVKLAVKVLNGRSDIIDIEIPVEGGGLHDSDYKVGKAVWKVLKNLIVKSGTPPPPDTTRVDSLNVEPLKMNSLIVPKDSVAVPLDTALNPLDTVVPVSPSDVQQDE